MCPDSLVSPHPAVFLEVPHFFKQASDVLHEVPPEPDACSRACISFSTDVQSLVFQRRGGFTPTELGLTDLLLSAGVKAEHESKSGGDVYHSSHPPRLGLVTTEDVSVMGAKQSDQLLYLFLDAAEFAHRSSPDSQSLHLGCIDVIDH